MIEAAMDFVLGLLAAGLLALAVTPAVWRRAARLARTRVEGGLPLSLAEIHAQRDQLRAEFAVSTRKLELTARRLEDKTAEQAVEIGRRVEEVARLSREHAARAEVIAGLEKRTGELSGEVSESERKLAAAKAELAARDESHLERVKTLATLTGDFEAAQQLIEEQQLEVVARNTQIANLSSELSRAALREAATTADQREAAFKAEKAALDLAIAAERTRGDALVADVARLQTERDEKAAELDRNTAELARLRGEVASAADQRRFLEVRLAAAETALMDARAGGAALRVAPGESIRVNGHAVVNGHAAIAPDPTGTAMAARLAALEGEAEKLRAENAELRRIGGTEWEADRAEQARLRERLAAVAVEVVRMGQTIAAGKSEGMQRVEDGTGAPRKLPMPRPPALRPSAEPKLVSNDGAPRSEGRTLADRIRALQHSTARH